LQCITQKPQYFKLILRYVSSLQDLQESGLLVEAPRFSKFLHGMALLYPNEVRTSPTWFLEDPDAPGTFTPASIEEMGDQTDVFSKVRSQEPAASFSGL
jgi:SPX domain protein involved in polyphosphate accumulation